jgi:menaquinone-specific isochorismate synthase
MRSTTVRLDDDLDPVALGARTGLLWCRDSSDDPVPVLAGTGSRHRIALSRPGGAEQAQSALAALAGDNEVGGPGTGPVAFTSLPFDRERLGELLVPEVVIGRGADGRRWLTVTTDDSDQFVDVDRVVAWCRSALERSDSSRGLTSQPSDYRVRSTLPPEQWRDEVVARARDRIEAGELEKAVLARELILATDQPIDVVEVVAQLRHAFPSAILFLIDGFVGASPELLVSRNGDMVRAHPLAGTASRSSDPSVDGRLAAGLLASGKDRWEHQITIDWLLDGLLPFCSYVDAEPEPSIVSLANVHHLGTQVEGRLSSPPVSVLELVAALHPTPAVGGAPQGDALALIADLEKAERGSYAGPTGWVDGAGNGAFAVAIRSAELAGTRARMFAGVGVVADSDPAAELAETRAKFRAVLDALIRP